MLARHTAELKPRVNEEKRAKGTKGSTGAYVVLEALVAEGVLGDKECQG